eukprot:Rmarinus@m.3535
MEVNIIGQVASATCPPTDKGLQCKWNFLHEDHWVLLNGKEKGITQVSFPTEAEDALEDRVEAVWSHPIDVQYHTQDIKGWPKIQFEIYYQTSDQHSQFAACVWCPVPSAPGRYELECATWRPLGKRSEEAAAVFTGVTPQLKNEAGAFTSPLIFEREVHTNARGAREILGLGPHTVPPVATTVGTPVVLNLLLHVLTRPMARTAHTAHSAADAVTNTSSSKPEHQESRRRRVRGRRLSGAAADEPGSESDGEDGEAGLSKRQSQGGSAGAGATPSESPADEGGGGEGDDSNESPIDSKEQPARAKRGSFLARMKGSLGAGTAKRAEDSIQEGGGAEGKNRVAEAGGGEAG